MQLYYGHCTCGYVYGVEGRPPNFCPECGTRLLATVEDLFASETKRNRRQPAPRYANASRS